MELGAVVSTLDLLHGSGHKAAPEFEPRTHGYKELRDLIKGQSH
jgi:hypothetical protein